MEAITAANGVAVYGNLWGSWGVIMVLEKTANSVFEERINMSILIDAEIEGDKIKLQRV